MARFMLWALCGLLLFSSSVWAAAITTNATGTLQSRTVAGPSPMNDTSLTIAAGSDRALTCAVSSRDGALPGVAMTWNTVSMTLSNSQVQDTWTEYVYIFTLLNPDTGSRTAEITWTGGGSFRLAYRCVAFDNVASVSGTLTNSSGNSANASAAITSASGDATVTALTHSGSVTAHTGTTLYLDSVHGSSQYILSSSGTDTHTYTHTSTNWGLAGIRLLQTGAAGGAKTLPMMGVGQ